MTWLKRLLCYIIVNTIGCHCSLSGNIFSFVYSSSEQIKYVVHGPSQKLLRQTMKKVK